MKPTTAEFERLNLLRDRAYADAEALRRAALDDFWRGADAALSGVAARALRASRRLAQRLQRHRTAASVAC